MILCAFVFHNFAVGNQKIFSFGTNLKHCNLICEDDDVLVAFEFSHMGIAYKVLKNNNIKDVCDGVYKLKTTSAIITTCVYKKHKSWWKPFLIRSCNEICRHISGVDVGLTLTPNHLYNKLFECDGKNYRIICDHGRK